MGTSIQKETGFYSLISDKTSDFAGRGWLFSEIKSWLNDAGGPRYFLITGKAGTGKSAISARLWQISEGEVNDKNLEKGFLHVIHVCSTRDKQSIDPTIFSDSLLSQLSYKIPTFVTVIGGLGYSKEVKINASMTNIQANTVIGPSFKINIDAIDPLTKFNKFVLGPLQKIAKSCNQEIIFLIDALDESLEFGSSSILSLVGDIRTLAHNVRFIVTSRDSEYIRDKFSNDGKVFSLSEEYYNKNSQDILEYIHFRMSKEPKLKNSYDQFADDLSKKSQDNFLYVVFLLNAIADGILELKRESLDSVPPFLDGLYHQYLSRIKEKDTNKWNNEIKMILAVLSVLFKAVDQRQLSLLAGINPLKTEQVISELKSFIRITHIPDKGCFINQYNLYHQSLVDFLFQKEYKSKNKNGVEYTSNNLFYIEKRDAHRIIAQKYYSQNRHEITLDGLDDYGLRYLPYHLLELSNYRDYENVNWYEQLLRLANGDTFEEMQLKSFPIEPDLNLKLKRQVFIIALEKNDLPSAIDLLLMCARTIKKLSRESPLDVLTHIENGEGGEESVDVILRKSWMVADSYKPEVSSLWYLLISWALDNKKRESDVKKTLDQLNRKRPKRLERSDDVMTTLLLYLLYEKYEEVSVLLDYFTSDDIYHVSKYLIGDKKIEKAIEITRYIKDSFLKSKSLSEIAQALVTNDVKRALSVANKVRNPSDKNEALSKIAQALASTDTERALSVANKIGNAYDSDKDTALSKIAQALARTDTERALSVAKMISYSRDEDEALSTIAQALVSTDVDRAISVANMIYDPSDKAQALSKITQSVVSIDRNRAKKVFDKAISVANKLDLISKPQALSKIAKYIIPIDRNRAKKVFDKAVYVTNKIKNPEDKSTALSEIAQALVSIDRDRAKKLFDEAISVANKIDNAHVKSDTLSEIAEALVSIDLDGAISVAENLNEFSDSIALSEISRTLVSTDVDRAVSVADKIKQPYFKSETLSEIAQALVSIDRDRAKKLFDEAISVANTIGDSDNKSTSLSTIAQALVSIDLDRAISIAENLNDFFHYSIALSEISRTLVSTDVDRAVSLANKIKNSNVKSTSLSEIAQALVTIDRDKAEKLFDEALSVVNERDYSYNKSEALSEIAQALLPTDVELAASLANRINDPYFKSNSLVQLAQALVSIDRDRAKKFFDEAISVTNTIDPSASTAASKALGYLWDKNEALSKIAQALVSTDVDRALSVANKIGNDSDKDTALSKIAHALVSTDSGRNWKKFFDKAVSVANMISDYSNKDEALSKIARSIVSTDVDRALSVANMISYFAYKDEALSKIAQALVSTDVDRALSVAKMIIDYSDKSKTLSEIAQALVSIDRDRAKKLFDEAVYVASKIDKAYFKSKSETLSEIAQALVSIDRDRAKKLFDEAISVANMIGDASDRSETLSEIAQALVSIDRDRAKKLFDEAISVANKIGFTPSDKGKGLSKIAQALASIDRDKAEKLFDEAVSVANKEDALGLNIETLSEIAQALVTIDRGKAEKLFNEVVSYAGMQDDPEYKFEALTKITQILVFSKFYPDATTKIIDAIKKDARGVYLIAKNLLKAPDGVWIYIMKQLVNYPEMVYSICALICIRNPQRSKEIVELMRKYNL